MSIEIQEIKPMKPKPLPPRIEKSLASWRAFFNSAMTCLTITASVLACVPLFSVLYMLLREGLEKISLTVFSTLTPPAAHAFGNSIIGTLIMVGIAGAISIPFGIMVGIYLAEFAGESKIASLIRFSAKVLTGLPSILAGVFAYGLVVVTTKKFSAVAGGIALAILMLPTVILTAEEAFKQVPRKIREAAFGIGCTRTQVVLRIVLPTALPGVLTGVMLAVARACGETAPLLFTTQFLEQRFRGDVTKPVDSLAVFIKTYSERPFEHDIKLAWTASLVMVALVLTLNILAQQLTRGSRKHQR